LGVFFLKKKKKKKNNLKKKNLKNLGKKLKMGFFFPPSPKKFFGVPLEEKVAHTL